MATDKLFHEYAVTFPDSVAKLIQAGPEKYDVKSLTLKETEKRAGCHPEGSGHSVIAVRRLRFPPGSEA